MCELDNIYRKIESVPDFLGHTIDSVNYRNGFGDSPLHVVSNWGDIEAIELLVASGADINSIGESGFTPLHCAAEQDCGSAIAKLIELGAQILKDEDGQTPLELAKLLDNQKAVGILKKYK